MGRTADSVQAFILVEAGAGQMLALADQIARIPGVKGAWAVTGPFDIIVHAVTPDLRALTQLVLARIQALADVNRTVTCIALSTED